MALAAVKTIYSSNYRDIPDCLDLLKANCESGKVDAIVTICCGPEGIDVRGMGDCDIHDVAGYLIAAQLHIARIILQSYERIGGGR